MTIEQSHGKARPTLPRASDLQPVPAVPDRGRSRDERGRATPGNTLARGRGWKRAIARMLGKGTTDPEAVAAADDAWRVFTAYMSELPDAGAITRGLTMRWARETTMSAYWSAKASEYGLASELGIAAEERAMKHGTRAERLAVTTLDVATRLAASTKARHGAVSFVDQVRAMGGE